MVKRTLIIIPTFNEAENIGRLTQRLLQIDTSIHVLVIDDASPDGTAEIVKAQEITSVGRLKVLKRTKKGGRGSAILEGFRIGLAEGYELFFEMDADFSHNPEEIPSFLKKIDEGYDMVLGSRYLPESQIYDWGAKRTFFSKWANVYARIVLKIPITDYTNGYRCYTRRAVAGLDMEVIEAKGYVVLSEVAYQLHLKGFRIGEVPTIFINRRRGISNLGWHEIKEAFLSVLRIRWKNMTRRTTILHRLFQIALSAAVLTALFDSFRAARYELLMPMLGDSSVYWAVGRGILNGLMPYRDLFEIKPPGIFWVSALSLWYGGLTLGHILSALSILFPALLLTSLGISLRRKVGRGKLITIAALLIGVTLTLHLSKNAAEFQVEPFGAIFATLYALILQRSRIMPRWFVFFTACLTIGGSILFKEPFILVCAAIAILFCKSWREWFEWFVGPVITTLLLGTVLMAALGYLDPYLNLYLREMFSHHIYRYGSPLIRSLEITKLTADMMAMSPFYLLLILLLGYRYIDGVNEKKSQQYVWILLGTIVIFSAGALLRDAIGGVVNPMEWHRMLLWGAYGMEMIGAGTFLWIVLNWNGVTKAMRTRAFKFLIAIILSTFAAGSGGEFYNHHLMFAIPVWAGIAIAWISSTKSDDWTVPVIILLASLTVFFGNERDYAQLLDAHGNPPDRAIAKSLDQLLDACHEDRYIYLGGLTGIFGFTRHSPAGPLFWQRADLLGKASQFGVSVTKNVKNLNVIVLREDLLGAYSKEIFAYIKDNFSETSPLCAKKLIPKQAEYKFLFRNTLLH